MGEKDITEKTLEAYNDVFADIVNGLLFGGEQVVKEDQLVDAQPTSMYKADEKMHEQERDVAKYWIRGEKGERVRVRVAFLWIENQTKYDKDMALRVIGYDGAAYRAELSVEDRYPVLTIVLYFGDQPWGKNRSLYDTIAVPEILRPYVNDYRINVFEIAHLSEKEVSNFQSDFQIVADYFSHKRTDPDYRPKDPRKFCHVDELLKMMSVIAHDKRFMETLHSEEGRPENMCEVLDRVEQRGREQGGEEIRLKDIQSLMKNLNFTAEKSMDVLGIPEAERGKYRRKLRQ